MTKKKMSETILSIDENENIASDIAKLPYGQGGTGFIIETDKRKIVLSVSNGRNCCESFGGFMRTEDDKQDFVGAKLLSVDVVDKALNVETKGNPPETEYLDEGGVMFVNLKTNRGVFQIAVYNSHNGYYGHSASFHSIPKDGKTVFHEPVSDCL